MAAKERRTDPPLEQELFEEAHRFEFFQAVRLLERIQPNRKPVGAANPPLQEVVRFRTHQTLSFPAGQIYELVKHGGDEGEAPPELMVSFMGLTGPLGVLPHHYTELIMERARYQDVALWKFLDIFNHRLISLFYRIWEKHRFPIAYERGGMDQFTSFLFDIVGMGTGGLKKRNSFNDQALIYYGGLVAQRPHSASSIAALLSDYFGVTVRAVQFSGQWLYLDENITRLGAAYSTLGVNTIAGARVWDSQSKFRIRIGPLTVSQLNDFVPQGSAFQPAKELLKFLTGAELDYDLQLIVKAAEVPSTTLGGSGSGPRLGWTSWLKTKPFRADDDQVVLPVREDYQN